MKKWGLLLVFILMISLFTSCGKTKKPAASQTGSVIVADTTSVKPSATPTGEIPENKGEVKPTEIQKSENEPLQGSSENKPGEQKPDHPPSGALPALYPVMNSEEKWGYIDHKGNLMIDYIYDHAYFFMDGAATVSINGKEGMIGLDGAYIIQPEFEFCGNFSEGWAHVIRDEAGTLKHGFASPDGTVFYHDQFNNNAGSFHDGLAVFESDGHFGYVNTRGEVAIEPVFSYAYDFSEGFAMVADDSGLCGFINTKGETVIDYQFENNPDGNFYYQGFSNGLAGVGVDGKYGFINTKGDYVIEPTYDWIEKFQDGVALVLVDTLFGYINEKGETIMEPQFAYASSFQNGYAFVKVQSSEDSYEIGGFGLIDKTGTFLTEKNLAYENGGGYTFLMEWSCGFVGDLARVAIAGDDGLRYVYINRANEIVWEMK